MNYLTHTEITENSIVMIDYSNGTHEPYFITQKRKGGISGGTMLLGRMLKDLVLDPASFPDIQSGKGLDRFYTSSDEQPKGGHRGVDGYRNLNSDERVELATKLKLVNLSVLYDLVSDS